MLYLNILANLKLVAFHYYQNKNNNFYVNHIKKQQIIKNLHSQYNNSKLHLIYYCILSFSLLLYYKSYNNCLKYYN